MQLYNFPTRRAPRACRGCGLTLKFHPDTHQFCKKCWAMSRLRLAVQEFSKTEQMPLQLQGGGRSSRWPS